MLTRRAFVASVLALAGAALVTGVGDLARAVALGTRAAMRRGMRVLEPQKGPWVNQNLWGDQRTQALPQAENQVVNVLGKNTIMYGPPAVHSVNLARGDETPAANAEVRARVTYGCGGVENSFDCDWVHGVQFAIVCNSLSVSAVTYNPFPSSPYDAEDGAVFLGASVAKGSTNSSRWPLTYTEPVTTFAGAGDADFPVRDFARALTVHKLLNSDPSVPTMIDVRFLDSSGTPLAAYNVQVCAGGAQIPIPGGCQVVQLHNTDGEGADVVLQWFLGL